MNLRNFLYINPELLDDYISAIDGYIYEEETLKKWNFCSNLSIIMNKEMEKI